VHVSKRVTLLGTRLLEVTGENTWPAINATNSNLRLLGTEGEVDLLSIDGSTVVPFT